MANGEWREVDRNGRREGEKEASWPASSSLAAPKGTRLHNKKQGSQDLQLQHLEFPFSFQPRCGIADLGHKTVFPQTFIQTV